jgi:hypothetical protein
VSGFAAGPSYGEQNSQFQAVGMLAGFERRSRDFSMDGHIFGASQMYRAHAWLKTNHNTIPLHGTPRSQPNRYRTHDLVFREAVE